MAFVRIANQHQRPFGELGDAISYRVRDEDMEPHCNHDEGRSEHPPRVHLTFSVHTLGSRLVLIIAKTSTVWFSLFKKK